MPPQRRVLAHRNRRALTGRGPEHAATPPGEPRQRPPGGTPSTTMPEQLIGSRFPGQQFPVGSVVTFLDRRRRTVFPAVTELRRDEAIVAAGEAGRWRVRYAGLRLVKAGPTGGATMQQVADDATQLLERHLNTGTLATRWRFRFETATGRAGICRHDTRTIALSVSFVLRAPWSDIRDTLLHEVAHAIVGPATDTTPCGRPPRDASAARRTAAAPSRTA